MLLVHLHHQQTLLLQRLHHVGEALEADLPLLEAGIVVEDGGLQDGRVHALEALALEALQRGGEGREPVGLVQLVLLRVGGVQADHQRGLLRPAAQLVRLGGDQRDQLAEGGAAEAALAEVAAQAHQRVLELAGIHLLLLLILHDGLHLLDQLVQIAHAGLALVLLLLLGLLGRYGLQEHEFAAGIDEDARGHLRAGDAQHELAHALELAHQGRVVAVAGDDAEAVDQRIGVGHLHGVDDQLDVQVVLLILSVAQGRLHQKGVGEQHLLQIGIAVGVAVDLAQQDVAPNLDLLNDREQHAGLAACVFQVHKDREIGFSHLYSPSVHFRFSGLRHSSSGSTKRPSLRTSTSSKYISPPPHSGVWMQTRSQCSADSLPL